MKRTNSSLNNHEKNKIKWIYVYCIISNLKTGDFVAAINFVSCRPRRVNDLLSLDQIEWS